MGKIVQFTFTTFLMIFLLSLAIPTSTKAASFSEGLSAFKNKDYPVALKIWKSVAKKGSPQAQFRLATMYRKGIGIPKDQKKAMKWFRLAAKQEKTGVSEVFRAQMNLGHYYQKGIAVNENKIIALKWYLSGSKGFRHYDFRRGTRISARMIAKIKEDMSEEEISKAEKLALEWKAKQKKSFQKPKVHAKTKKNSDTLYYWANYQSEELSNVEGDEDWTIEIKYSKDGKKYKAEVIFVQNSGGRGSGPCKGKVDSKGNLEKKVCDLDDFSERTLSGNIVRIELLNTGGGSSGGAVWIDKKMAAKKKQIKIKRQKELVKKKREAELARKKKEQEEKKKKLLAERKRKEEIARQKELVRKKLIAERKKKEQEEKKRKLLAERKRKRELARKKKAVELIRKKEIARKKLLAKRKLEAEKKRKRILAERKRKKELQLKLFPPLSSKATKLSNDIQLFLQKNPETPYLIEIATLIGKVKQSQKKKEVLRLKENLETFRTLLTKVKGFSAFQAKMEKTRKIARLKLLNKKMMSGNDLRNFLRSYVAKNMLNDSENVQKILPVLKKLDASLKSPKLNELNKLLPEIQKFILKTSSLRKEVVKLRKKKELARKRELKAIRKKEIARQKELVRKKLIAERKKKEQEEKKRKLLAERKRKRELARKKKQEELARKKELEAKRKKELEAKRRNELQRKLKESEKKKLLTARKKAKELKKKALSKESNLQKKTVKMDDFQISEIVQKKIKEKKFKEAKQYTKKIQDPDIRNLFLKNIQLQDKSKPEKKNNIRVKKKKSSKPHLLFGVSSSKDTFEFVQEKNKFDEITYYRYQFGCSYQLNVTNNTKEKVNISMIKLKVDTGIIKGWQGKKANFSFYKLTKPGENIVSQNSAEIYELLHLKPSKKLSNAEIQKRKKRHGCAAQKNKINIRKSFLPFIDFRKGSPLKKIDIFKLIRQTSPLTPK